jgi:hypothetical protein
MFEDKSTGAIIDELYNRRAERLAIERTVKQMKQDEETLSKIIKERLVQGNMSKASGLVATASPYTDLQPQVEDWALVHKYVSDNDAFHLLQRRLSVEPWRELITESGILVPGTVIFENEKLSITKVSR